MNTLNWRIAREVLLTAGIIPHPNPTSQRLQYLTGVRVAFDGGFVHIDPREVGAPDHDRSNPEFPVYVLPASLVGRICYMEPKE